MTAAAPSHFAVHRQKVFTPAEIAEGKSRPWGIEQGLERLEKFFTRKADWQTPPEGRLARQILLYHTRSDNTRAIRDQFLHSCHQVLKVLISSVNAQRNNSPLSFLQVRRVSLEELAELTGFARSTVIAVVKALTRAGILRTKRRKTDDRQAELVATRWLTPSLFEMLGLGNWIKKQSRNQEEKKEETPGDDRRRGEKPSGKIAQVFQALDNAKPPPPRRTQTRGNE